MDILTRMSEYANNKYIPSITISSPDGDETEPMEIIKRNENKVIARCKWGHIHIFYDIETLTCKTCSDVSKSRKVRELAEAVTGYTFMLLPSHSMYFSYDLAVILICAIKSNVEIPEKYGKYKKIWLGNYMRISTYQIISKICDAVSKGNITGPADDLPPDFIPFTYK